MVTEQMKVELRGESTSIADARQAARSFARECGASPEDLALATSEAVTNAILHGYREGSDGRIELIGYRNGDHCVLEVADRGVGMMPHPDSQGLGMGLPVIGRIAEHVEIIDGEPGTVIRMRFAIA